MVYFVACLYVFAVVTALTTQALSVCPTFEVVRDAETGATMAAVENMDVFSRKRLWDGDTSPRVPLDNFQRTFPACFASVSPYGDSDGGVSSSSSSSSSSNSNRRGTQPLVSSTTTGSSSSSSSSSTTSTGERIVALPFARNPPPGEDYCTSENAMVSVGGKTYCNDYAQFVLAEKGSTITPLSPDCVPPNCYPCASDPTGLGVYASKGVENEQQYCDPNSGLCFTLWVCVPNIGCGAHSECDCGQTCAANGPRPIALGSGASRGEKQWYYISDDDQPVFNNTLTAGGGIGCCTFTPREPVCRFQSVSCACLPAYTPLNTGGNAQTYEKKDRKRLDSTFRQTAAEYGNSLQCCTGMPAEPVYFFNSMEQNDHVTYTIASRCQNPADVQRYQSGVNPVLYAATASYGRMGFDDAGVPPDMLDDTACVRVWRGTDFTDVSAYFCTSATGEQGRYGKLEWVARANPDDPASWWQADFGGYNSGKIGQWNADIRSFVVSKNAEVTFFQNNWFDTSKNFATYSNCECRDTKSKGACCNGKDWNISSLTIRRLK